MAHVLNTCFLQKERLSDMLIAIAQLFQRFDGPSSIGWQVEGLGHTRAVSHPSISEVVNSPQVI